MANRRRLVSTTTAMGLSGLWGWQRGCRVWTTASPSGAALAPPDGKAIWTSMTRRAWEGVMARHQARSRLSLSTPAATSCLPGAAKAIDDADSMIADRGAGLPRHGTPFALRRDGPVPRAPRQCGGMPTSDLSEICGSLDKYYAVLVRNDNPITETNCDSRASSNATDSRVATHCRLQ